MTDKSGMESTVADDGESRMSRAGVVAQRVQIKNIYLTELVCRSEVETTNDDVKINVSVQTSTSSVYKTDEEELHVIARCRVAGQLSDAEQAVGIDATFRLVYELPRSDDLTQEYFDAFGEINGLFNLWPFWRELVQNMTVRMGLPPLILPVRRGMTLRKKPTQKGKTDLPQLEK